MNQSEYEPTTWYDPRLERRVSPTHGHGLFATAPIRTGETVMNWGRRCVYRGRTRHGETRRRVVVFDH